MNRKIPLVDSKLVESYSAVLDILKDEGYDGSINVSDFYFANRKKIDPIIYGPNVHSDEFANIVRWHSLIGIECKKAIIEYFKAKIKSHEDHLAKKWSPEKTTIMLKDPDWDKKIQIDLSDFYTTIDFSDFTFQFNNRSLRIKDFTYTFPLGRIGEVDLIGIDLTGIKLRNCKLVNICFHNANFNGAKLFQMELLNTTFSNVSFRHAILGSIQVKQGSFFNGADFRGACVSGINPLGDTCLTEPFLFNEVSYFKLVFLSISRFLRLGSKQMVSQQSSRHTVFAGNPTNELTLPSTKSLKEYIVWYQNTYKKIDRLPSTSFREGLAFVLSVVTTKHWTSYLALAISALCLNFFFTGLYTVFVANFTGVNDDLITLFYQSVLIFTSFGFDKLTPLTHFGKIIVLTEIILGYVTLALFVYLMAKKIDRNY